MSSQTPREMGPWLHCETHSEINSLAPRRPGCHFKTAIFNLVQSIGIFTSSNDNALRWMPRDLTDDNSTLVQVMAWYRQATSHYLSQCWPSSMSLYGVSRPQCVKVLQYETQQIFSYLHASALLACDFSARWFSRLVGCSYTSRVPRRSPVTLGPPATRDKAGYSAGRILCTLGCTRSLRCCKQRVKTEKLIQWPLDDVAVILNQWFSNSYLGRHWLRYGLLLDGTKPLPETMLTYHQRKSVLWLSPEIHCLRSAHELNP